MSCFKVAGMMSGTSLDGLDIVFCEFIEKKTGWEYKIRHGTTVPLGDALTERLAHAMKMQAHELAVLHHDFGVFSGKECMQFQKETGFVPDLISSHGHTVFHQPERGITLQIGNGNIIADITGKETIYDFRSGDVALGGQGAPLVPVGDEFLFSEYACCLNLGGIANLSFRNDGKRMAYDITALNQVFNYLAQRTGAPFDNGGILASSGNPDIKLLKYFDSLSYYSMKYPKSLGKEWVDSEVIMQMEGKDTYAMMRTWAEHAAGKTGDALNEICKGDDRVLATGGGAKNKFFLSLVQKKIVAGLHIPGSLLVDFKEAMIFAFLGLLCHLRRNNILSSVTGASRDSIGGTIVKP